MGEKSPEPFIFIVVVEGVVAFPCSGEGTELKPSKFWNGLGDGRFFDFDAVEPVLESTWLGFLLEKTENKADVHPIVAGGVEGLLFWLLGVEDMVEQ